MSTIHFLNKVMQLFTISHENLVAFPDDEGCWQPLHKVIIGIFRNRWDQLAPQWMGTIPKNNTIHSWLPVLPFSQN
jgi:hypothetical protein